jgi:hypothetical protein
VNRWTRPVRRDRSSASFSDGPSVAFNRHPINAGTYRLGYILYPTGMGTLTDELADLSVMNKSGFLHVPSSQDSMPSIPGGLGSYTAASSKLTFSYTSGCDTFGGVKSAPGDAVTYDYSVDGTTLSLFRTEPSGIAAVYVYYNVKSVCTEVTSDPSSPADSFMCRSARSCVCATSTDPTDACVI